MNDVMSFTSSNDVDDLSNNFGSVSIGHLDERVSF